MIKSQYYGEFQDMATQHMLAPIFFSLVATKAINEGGLFIFNNELYKALTDLAVGDEIVIGDGTGANDNAIPAKTMAEEVGNNKIKVASFTTTASTTNRQAMNGLRTSVGGYDALKQLVEEHWDTLVLKLPGPYLFPFATCPTSSNINYIAFNGVTGFGNINLNNWLFAQDGSNNIYRVSTNGATPVDNSTTAITAVFVGEWAIYY